MDRFASIGTAVGYLVFVIGLTWALAGHRPQRVARLGAYIVGYEVLARMTRADLPWEFGKYAVSIVFAVSMLRARSRPTVGPLLYFSLLLPSTIVTFDTLPFEPARQAISYNLSGHFAVMMCAWFFSNVRMDNGELKKLLLALILPITGVSTIVLTSTLTNPDIRFEDESNFATSGGYGPNQVSAVLGLGAVACFLYLLAGSEKLWLRIAAFSAMVGFTAQSALTFSRGGLVVALGSIAVAGLFALRDRRSRFRFLMVVLLGAAVGEFVLFPVLDRFTGGAIVERFENVGTTGRDVLIMEELSLFRESPVFGVGPGVASIHRRLVSHTEFSRVLAEHGLLGFASLAILTTMCFFNIKRAPSHESKAVTASLCTWTFLFTLTSAMRLAAPAFALGVTFVTFADSRSRNSVSIQR
jgi:hypothetical protein